MHNEFVLGNSKGRLPEASASRGSGRGTRQSRSGCLGVRTRVRIRRETYKLAEYIQTGSARLPPSGSMRTCEEECGVSKGNEKNDDDDDGEEGGEEEGEEDDDDDAPHLRRIRGCSRATTSSVVAVHCLSICDPALHAAGLQSLG